VADRAVAQKKLIRAQTVVAIPGRGSAVSDEDNAEMLKIADIFDEAALTPPATSQLQETLSLDTRRLGQLLGFMRRSGKIIKVSTEQHYSAESLKSLRLRLIDSLATSDDLSASDFKDIAGGISRKYAIPLLEYFDREKVTMRVGNLRKLHPSQRQEASN
jgi:selenocysteine-specific elongation factor